MIPDTLTAKTIDDRLRRLVAELRAERAHALTLLAVCPVGSTAYFWCQGRIGATELALLKAGFSLEQEPS